MMGNRPGPTCCEPIVRARPNISQDSVLCGNVVLMPSQTNTLVTISDSWRQWYMWHNDEADQTLAWLPFPDSQLSNYHSFTQPYPWIMPQGGKCLQKNNYKIKHIYQIICNQTNWKANFVCYCLSQLRNICLILWRKSYGVKRTRMAAAPLMCLPTPK